MKKVQNYYTSQIKKTYELIIICKKSDYKQN